MTNSIGESLTIPLARPESNSLSRQDPRVEPLFVRECVPAGAGFTRVARLHTAHVNSPREALALPWIEKLPGEKQVRVIDGQVFVIQKYVGCRLIRAHIFHDGQRKEPDLVDSDRISKAKREMSLAYVG